MWSRVASFATGNDALRLTADDRLELNDGYGFVFGGDAIDRGPDGLRVLRALVDAKRRYGNRVQLLAGNRDINKLRLRHELAGHPYPRAPDEARGSRPTMLKWIFQRTMGAAGAFEFRRTELQRGSQREVSDEQVVQSVLADVEPGGLLLEYLEHAQLAYRSGRTLFVHGGICGEALGHVPGEPPIGDVDRWVQRLNHFYREHLAAYRADARRGDEFGWAGLLNYQAPKFQGRNPQSVVYGRTVDELNNPLLPPAAVTGRLRDVGIDRLVVGHTPTGDVPAVLRGDGFELVVADNSHAGHGGGSRVLIAEDALVISAEAKLTEGLATVSFRLARDEDSAIGQRLTGGRELVVGAGGDGRFLLFSYLPAYEMKQRLLSRDSLGKLQGPGRLEPGVPGEVGGR